MVTGFRPFIRDLRRTVEVYDERSPDLTPTPNPQNQPLGLQITTQASIPFRLNNIMGRLVMFKRRRGSIMGLQHHSMQHPQPLYSMDNPSSLPVHPLCLHSRT